MPGDETDKVSCVQQKQNWPQDTSLRYAITKQRQRTIVSTDIQSFCRVQGARASGRQTSAILFDVVRFDAIVTVRIPSTSLDRDSCTPSNGGHFCRLWVAEISPL